MPLPADFEKSLWAAADQLWTNSALQPSEYSWPVLALLFLKYADHHFGQAEKKRARGRRRGSADKNTFHNEGVLYVPESARYERLLDLPESADIGKALNEAMKAIEAANRDLKHVLPKSYGRLEPQTLKALLRTFATIPDDVQGDAFGRIYEHFLDNFAALTLPKGGEFFTPYSIVRLVVEIVEPYHGRIYDPACGWGGTFVQTANFIREHQKNAVDDISIFGIEKNAHILHLAKLNLAVHGLSGDIRETNSYYDDIHNQVGQFDFVMANPPFNQSAVDKERIENDKRRFPFGMPRVDNANYLWIQLFYSALNDKGRAGFVMAPSASDARASELELRKRLLRTGAVDVMVTISSNFFYTVTLPATLWFLDKGKATGPRKDKVLFIDARHIYRQVDRTRREFTAEQIEFVANIVRLYRGAKPENVHGSTTLLKEMFPKGTYADVPGLCKVAALDEIELQGCSLNPGRYVSVIEDNASSVRPAQSSPRRPNGRELATGVRRLTDFLDELDGLVSNPTVPEAALHTVIQGNPWILGPNYNLIASDKTLEQIIKQCFGQTFTGPRARTRPDLLLARKGPVGYLLVEFKRPAHRVSRDDELQAIKYRDDLSWYVNKPIEVLIIGGRRDPGVSPAYSSAPGLQVTTYYELLSDARARLEWFLQSLGLASA